MAAIQASEITDHPSLAANQTGSAGGVINNSINISEK